jgi:hypothetical protein
MNPQPDPTNPDNQNFELPSVKEFGEWLKADQEIYEWWQGVIERCVKGEYGELPPEMFAAAERALAKRKEALCVKAVGDKFKALMELTQQPADMMLAEDRLAQANAMMDEITDALLETPEPHRTAFLKQVLPLREKLRAVKLPD